MISGGGAAPGFEFRLIGQGSGAGTGAWHLPEFKTSKPNPVESYEER